MNIARGPAYGMWDMLPAYTIDTSHVYTFYSLNNLNKHAHTTGEVVEAA